MISIIGLGGFVGALLSGYMTSSFSDKTLEFIFLSFATFALFRLFLKTKEHKKQREVNKIVLLLIGVLLGAVSMTIGVGGSILLTPILVGYFHVPLNKAISSGLFFVVFSSVAGLISHTSVGHVDYESGLIIGVASLAGVYIGIHLKDSVDVVLQKRLIVGFYILVVSYLTSRVFF
jgi:hypothetical protein